MESTPSKNVLRIGKTPVKRNKPNIRTARILSLLILFVIFCFSGASFVSRLFRPTEEASADIASFFPTTCLGGWENTDKATGPPEVREADDTYSDSNSTSVFNSAAQIFCSGFTGEIPENSVGKKIVLRFSWALEEGEERTQPPDESEPREENSNDETEETDVLGASTTDATEESNDDGLTEEESAPIISDDEAETPDFETPFQLEPSLEPEPEAEQESEPEEPEESEDEPESEPSPQTSSFWNWKSKFIRLAFAQEVEAPPSETEFPIEVEGEIEQSEEDPEEMISEDDGESVSTTTDEVTEETLAAPGALLEILYTLDGREWHSLGHVEKITSEVTFELPIEMFAEIEDLKKVQIAVHTLPTFDSVPKIYLDSLWLEVEYEKDLSAVRGSFHRAEADFDMMNPITASVEFDPAPCEGTHYGFYWFGDGPIAHAFADIPIEDIGEEFVREWMPTIPYVEVGGVIVANQPFPMTQLDYDPEDPFGVAWPEGVQVCAPLENPLVGSSVNPEERFSIPVE